MFGWAVGCTVSRSAENSRLTRQSAGVSSRRGGSLAPECMYPCASGPHVGPVVGSVVGLAAGCAIGRTVGCAVGGLGASDEACSMTAVPRFAPHSEQNLADSLKAAPHSPQNLGG